MIEMKYTLEPIQPIIIAKGKYNHIEYWVVNYGTHPCAYLGFDINHEFYKKNYMDIDVNCHGGLTFSGFKEFSDKWLIGWDYAHFTDYCTFMRDGHKWTTAEIIQEIMGVIDENKLEA